MRSGDLPNRADLSAWATRSTEIVFQPVVDVKLGKVFCLEALARFPDLNSELSVREVIAHITGLKLSLEFDLMVISKALNALHRLELQHGPGMTVSVNVCADTLLDERFLPGFQALSSAFLLRPSQLKLEIDEYSLETPAARRCVAQLTALGIELIVDSFIAGSQSFEALRNKHVKAVKTDPAVAQAMAHSETAHGFLRGMNELSRSLGKELIVEGVERGDQIALLDKMGCRYMQGNYFCQPVPEAQLPIALQVFANESRLMAIKRR